MKSYNSVKSLMSFSCKYEVKQYIHLLHLCGTDTVAKLPLYIHATRGLSHGHVDGVAVAWRRADAIEANLKFRKLQKQTLSQHHVLNACFTGCDCILRKSISCVGFMSSTSCCTPW